MLRTSRSIALGNATQKCLGQNQLTALRHYADSGIVVLLGKDVSSMLWRIHPCAVRIKYGALSRKVFARKAVVNAAPTQTMKGVLSFGINVPKKPSACHVICVLSANPYQAQIAIDGR